MNWSKLAENNWQVTAVWASLALTASIGLLAVLSPKRFTSLASSGSRWIDTDRLLTLLDRRVDIDQYVIPHARLLGLSVIAAVGLLAWLIARYT